MQLHESRELRHIVHITLPASSQYLDSILQLQTRMQLGLPTEELFSLLQACGLSPKWESTPRADVATLSVQVPEHAPLLLTCQMARVTLH